MNEKEIFAVIDFFYPREDELKKTLLKHSLQVRDKAFELASRTAVSVDMDTVNAGALLHDIGIKVCHAPGIFCYGELHYLRHGIEGAEMLRLYGKDKQIDLEAAARICERHTGSGLTALEITTQNLPLPPQDLLPETAEEKLVCLADKFFSKSGNMEEKTFEAVRRSMAKFGQESLDRFEKMWDFFSFRSV
jgi:uncharacterized protein